MYDNFPHYYTGAVVSAGYPIPLKVQDDIFPFMYIGGEPHNTYTTVTLHSPPSLLSDGYITTLNAEEEVFTADYHTPISINSGDEGHLALYLRHDLYALRPAFLLSFECECSRR